MWIKSGDIQPPWKTAPRRRNTSRFSEDTQLTSRVSERGRGDQCRVNANFFPFSVVVSFRLHWLKRCGLAEDVLFHPRSPLTIEPDICAAVVRLMQGFFCHCNTIYVLVWSIGATLNIGWLMYPQQCVKGGADTSRSGLPTRCMNRTCESWQGGADTDAKCLTSTQIGRFLCSSSDSGMSRIQRRALAGRVSSHGGVLVVQVSRALIDLCSLSPGDPETVCWGTGSDQLAVSCC